MSNKKPSDGSRNAGSNSRHRRHSGTGSDSTNTREFQSRPKVRFDMDKPLTKSYSADKEDEPGTYKRRDSQELPLCLNKAVCKKRHFVKDCPDTSKEKAAELLKAHMAERSKKGKLNLLSQTPETADALQGTGRYFAKLADKVDVVANGDCGADHSALSEHHLQQCADANIYVQVLPLAHPIGMLLALADDEDEEPKEYLAHKKARISTTLNTTEGPLRLRKVEFLVFKERMAEILLSRPLLQSLGFNLDEHLSKVRNTFHDADFSHIGFSPNLPQRATEGPPTRPGKLSRMLLRPAPDVDPSMPDLDLQADETDSDNELPDLEDTAVTNEDHGAANNEPWPAFYGDIVGDDTSQCEEEIEVGQDDAENTKQHLQNIVSSAIANGLPEQLRQEFSDLIFEYADVFRTRLGADPPADVEPMRIRLRHNASPVRVRVRRYSPPQAEFLRNKTDELLRLGLVRRNNSSEWASAPLIVPKNGPEKFRFTVDLRPVNSQTVPHTWPRPDLESVTAQLAGKAQFALIDLCHGYWQMPLHPDSQECQSFITPDGVFTPVRVMHGQTNAATYFQSVVGEAFISLRDVMLQWLDDILLHGTSHQDLLDTIKSFLHICRDRNLKLHALKVLFFLPEVNWCGRLISSDGVRMDPKRLDALLAMQPPTMGHQLQQFVCAANWMRAGIPEFSRIITPLSQALEDVYAKAGSRKKRAVERITEKPFWTAQHVQTFEKIKKALKHAVTLAHPNDSKQLCLFTDASNDNWAGVLTQIPPQDKDEPFESQRHEPLSFLSGAFRGASSRWSVPEKEAFAIIESVTRLDYMLLRPEGFLLHTDHKNLTYIFNPVLFQPRIAKHTANKIERWAMRLSAFRYTIIHISGEDNVWADLLSRWAAPAPKATSYSGRLSALFKAPVTPDLDPDFKWPQPADIKRSQQLAIEKGMEQPPTHLVGGLRQNDDGSVWIPTEDTKMQLHICIVGHCGRGGHRGIDTTFNNIKGHFFWKNMKSDITVFCNTSLHCLSTIGGHRVPRPLSHTMHASKPNELIHFDFLYIGDSTTGPVYILIIKDDASSFIWLEPCDAADAEYVINTLLKWFSLFGVVLWWISDQGSHFMNKVMTGLNRALHAHHHYTTAYSPQSNGTVEIVCEEVLRAARALTSEPRILETEWPVVLPIIQRILNHTTRPSLDNRAPVTLFTGLPADNPLRTIMHPQVQDAQSIEVLKAQRLMEADKLISSLDKMHRETAEKRTRRREEAIQRHNRKTGVQSVNFGIGDYVLLAKRVSKGGRKLKVRWTGPVQIIRAVTEVTFEVKNLITDKLNVVHANRLKFYADSKLDVTEELLDTVAYNQGHLNKVEGLLSLRFNPDAEVYEVQVKWEGFDHEDPTWEPLSVLQEDIPKILETFLKNYPDQDMVDKALQD